MENMTKERAKEIVAKKYGLGTTLVTGHKASYWEEAMDLVLASGSVAAPTWYTENEMYDWLTRNNYHENIAKELSSKWAADLRGAFNKGFEKGTRELASLRQQLEQKTIALDSYYKLAAEVAPLKEALKELLPIAQWGYDLLVPFDKERMGKEWPAIIERARKLLSK